VIFVTVGHQMPFDRLVRAVDEWSARCGRTDVFAQIGSTQYQPARFPFAAHVSPDEFMRRVREATGIVAHAGTGTIIAALQLGKPLLVLPRLSRLGETRNDHQIPTAKHFAERGYVLAANDEAELIDRIADLESFRPRETINGQASPELLRRLREFVAAS